VLLTERYAAAAKHAREAGDDSQAALWLTRLVRLDPLEPDYRYQLAKVLDHQGEHARAWALMEELGPVDEPGYAPADLWLARRLSSGAKVSARSLQAAWQHAGHVLRQTPDSEEARRLSDRVLARLSERDDCEGDLRQSADQDPEMRVLLAAVYARQGKPAAAEHEARLAEKDLSEQISKMPARRRELRLRLADAKVLAGDFHGTEQILTEMELDEPLTARWRLSRLYLDWYDALGSGDGTLVQRCSLLKRALDIVPWSLPAITRLLKLTRQSPAEAAWSSDVLERIDWKAAPAEAHLLVALDEWQQGDLAAARQHLEAAHRADPKDVRAAQKLAQMLVESEPIELSRALGIVDRAITQAPGQPSLLGIRGRILCKLSRWSDALSDLEPLEKRRPKDKQLHELLAECYAGLGMTELAKRQHNLAAAPGNAKNDGQPADDATRPPQTERAEGR
jgi:tetratricopeptide (TPR) repeat protein